MQESTSFPKSKIKILLLEGVSHLAFERLKAEGYQVEYNRNAMSKEELLKAIPEVHMIGIRSATTITAEVLAVAKRLLCIGCFCIGTNQVDLEAAAQKGISVFNSPFSNTRSVAELIIAQLINLARKLGDKNMQLHNKLWEKSSASCYEIRGKTLGIIGYGHIGTQLSVLAEALGMKVQFFDVVPKLALGNSRATSSLNELLSTSDFVTLHVPETSQTKNMIGQNEIAMMKQGSFLLNASRGTVVDIPALEEALKTGHLAGAYLDVYPSEPKEKKATWDFPLQGLPNVLMTPHIGGSTEEAQAAIGEDVANKIVAFINTGNSHGSVNIPQINLPNDPSTHRILNIHKNVPGVLREINNLLQDYNITAQILGTKGSIGYMMLELESEFSHDLKHKIAALTNSIRTRILY